MSINVPSRSKNAAENRGFVIEGIMRRPFCHCEAVRRGNRSVELEDMAIPTGSDMPTPSVVYALWSVAHGLDKFMQIDNDCHIVELLAMTNRRLRQSSTAVLVHLVHTYLWRIHSMDQTLVIDQRQPPSRHRYGEFSVSKETMHIYNKTNKEIVAMAPYWLKNPTKKAPLAREGLHKQIRTDSIPLRRARYPSCREYASLERSA